MGARLAAVLLLVAACGQPSGISSDSGTSDAASFDAYVIDGAPDAPFDARPDAPPDAPPDAMVDTGTPTIVVGAPDRILLLGTIVTPDVAFVGAVLVEGNMITCVDTADVCTQFPAATGATIIDTKAVIAPGLVDTHNHILFDMFDETDWAPPALYMDHDQWPSDPKYLAMLDVKQCLVNDSQGKPAWCTNTVYGTPAGSLRCEADKWGELKGLIAGTTSIVGLPGTSAACFGSLARSVDVAQNGLGQDKIQTSATFPPSNGTGVCTNFGTGKTTAFLVHAGEGIDPRSLNEFTTLGTTATPNGCLYAPQTAITHGTAFTATELTAMAAAGMKLTWSPKSNVVLYGATADIPTALDAGVTIALAPDWSISGSQNLLDEMRFADQWDNDHWADRLHAQDLVAMATSHGAQVLALSDKIGALAPGYLADISVFAGDVTHPFDAIVAASPHDVRLVMVGGTVLYGDATLAAAGPVAPGCEAVDICGAAKFLCTATASTASKLDQTSTQIHDALSNALTDADAQTPDDGYDFAPLAPLVKCPS